MRGIKLYLIYLVIITITLSTMVGCAQAPPVTPDTPRYTADQVIAVAQAQYPVCFKKELIGYDGQGMAHYRTITIPPTISVKYMDGSKAVWKIEVSCPQSYRLPDRSTEKELYFYEGDGSLQDRYYPF